MFVIQWTTLAGLLMVATMTYCQLDETVWCPPHLKVTSDENNVKYKHCQPDFCINLNVNSNEDTDQQKSLCLDDDSKAVLHDTMVSESCHWVRLRKDRQFHLNLNDGSIYEFKTNHTYKWGEYVYFGPLEEAIICREELLPNDDTNDVTLWCHSHTMYVKDAPARTVYDGLYIAELDLTITKRFLFQVSYDHINRNYQMDFCLKMDSEFMRCEYLIEPAPFEILPNLSLLVEWDLEHKMYPVGQYYITADNNSAIVCSGAFAEYFSDNLYVLYIVSAVSLFFTALVQLFYPKLNYNAKEFLCHTVNMMVMYIFMVVRRFDIRVESEAGRFFMVVSSYVSQMSSYVWLSVIFYGVCKVYVYRSSQLFGSEKKRWLVMRCLWAWGVPVVLYVLGIVLSYDSRAADYLGLDSSTIFVLTHGSVLIFYYVPIAVILVVILGFLGPTIWNMRRTSQWTPTINQKINKKIFYLCVKLFVVMSITWLIDAMIFYTAADAGALYWNDVIIGLQGVVISMVYVCHKSTWRTMRGKCGATHLVPTSETKTSELSRGRLTFLDPDRNKPIPHAEVPLVTVNE